MHRKIISILAAIACLLGLAAGAAAAEVDCDTVYCFTSRDFSAEEPLAGICVTGLPQPETGTVMLGSRVLRVGDILTGEQVTQMTFSPLRREEDAAAQVTYLPIYENRVAPAATMTISIRGKADKAPEALDLALETYKNLPAEGMLRANDPEGQSLTFSVVRPPRRGEVAIREDGSFTYTPKKNKVGVDSFVYTASDPAGKVSREATVTIQILKPVDRRLYSDTVGMDCRFEAEWMKNTGLFVGESVNGESCFRPEKNVTGGEFLAMVVKTLDIPMDGELSAAVPEDTPNWLKPYLAAALRSGLLTDVPGAETFGADLPITGGEAAVMLQNALDLSAGESALATGATEEELPAWAAASLTILRDNGIELVAGENLTRAKAAEVLYQVSRLAVTAPGTAVFAAEN